MSDSEEENYSDVDVIDDFSDNEEPGDNEKDPFADFLDGDDGDDDVVEIKEETEEPEVKKPFKDPLPLNSFGGAGIFSNDTAAEKASTSTSTNTETIDGTSIIGDAPYLPKTTEIKPKLKLPETPNFSHIKNKTQKRELYAKFLKEKRKIEKARGEDRRKRRMNETQEERDKKKALFGKTTAQVDYSQKTIENQRVWDETTVPVISEPGKLPTEFKQIADPEIHLEDQNDEFANYFKGIEVPKVLITTSENARNKTWKLALELGSCIPNSFVLKRKRLGVKQIIKQAKARNFTSVMVINDDKGTPNGMLISHLPEGPTALFRLSNPVLRCEFNKRYKIKAKGRGEAYQQPSNHRPELIIKRFGTRLGHRVSKLFSSLYPHDPQFRGRQVATFYNQRDFIFFRMHRYQFAKMGKKCNLQEMGPRFTLKLRYLQLRTFDSKKGDFEWMAKMHEQDVSRRKFHL